MKKELTEEQEQLIIELRKKREYYHIEAKKKYKQMIDALKKYNKIKNSHDYFVNEHNRIDRKLFLLTPGITFIPSPEKKEKRTKKKKQIDTNIKLLDALGDDAESILKKLISKRKSENKSG